jgi:hypothetical protein
MSFETAETKIYAHDGRAERILVNFHNYLITNLIKRGSDNKRILLVTDAQCRISFKIDDYRSHFKISILVLRGAGGEKYYTLYLRFNAFSFTEYALSKIENVVYQNLCGPGKTVREYNWCYQLLLRYHDQRLCAENIFSDICPAYITDLRDYLRSSSHIAFFIRGSEKI